MGLRGEQYYWYKDAGKFFDFRVAGGIAISLRGAAVICHY